MLLVSGPVKVSADQQLGHLCMMSTFHGNKFHIKPLLPPKLSNSLCIVVCHEKISGDHASYPEKLLMVEVCVGVQSSARHFPSGRIRRIDEEYSIRPESVLFHDF